MKIQIFGTASLATKAATDWLATRLIQPETRNVMVAGGNTPLSLYAQVAQRDLLLSHLNVFALDEYVGVPKEEHRNCANLIRQAVVRTWKIPTHQYHPVSSCKAEAAASIADHEKKIESLGGLDLVILGLGRNGHVGFNEPGSEPQSVGRVVPLSEISVKANHEWFGGVYAPSLGVTTGMRTILAARCVVLLAFSEQKADAVFKMIKGSQTASCPASYLQDHPNAFVFLDELAADRLPPPVTASQRRPRTKQVSR